MLDNLSLITYCSSHPLAMFHQWSFNLPEFCGWAIQHLGHTTLCFCPHNEVTANVKREKWECSFDTTLPSLSADQKVLWRANSKHPRLLKLLIASARPQEFSSVQVTMAVEKESESYVFLWVSKTSHLLTRCTNTWRGVKETISSWTCKPAQRDRKAALTVAFP